MTAPGSPNESLKGALMMTRALIVVAALSLSGCLGGSTGSRSGSGSVERPSILWIVADDFSPALGCYGDPFATTPHLDRFAKESVLYTHAFATAPACSPARATLINGVYAPTYGNHPMRSTFPLPPELTGFPGLLRKAGYYTSNNVKTDYNSGHAAHIIRASWDESSETAHWRKRSRADQPFFSISNLMTTHQSRAMVWPHDKFAGEVRSRLAPAEIHDPSRVPIPPYYPDTPVVRKTVARHYDCVRVMDKEVGALLRDLEENGLADDTIVFFYSDHGSGLPRHKRVLLDSGMRVPLLVRFPERWRHLAPGRPGTRTDRLVSFVDFGPSVLSLAGVDIPRYMQGEAFLGEKEGTPREYAFGHRDRIDEAIDLARSVRDRRYLYIRTYMPHLGYTQPTAWPDLGEIQHEFYRLARRDLMTDPQWHFAGPTREVEELYDCQADPINLRNLAALPEHQATLKRLRQVLADHLINTRDLGFLPEAEIQERTRAGLTPFDLGVKIGPRELARWIGAASQVGVGAEPVFLKHLVDRDAAVRYWGAVGLSAAETLSEEAAAALGVALEDPAPSVRVEAGHALARHGHAARAVPVLARCLGDKNLAAVLHAARAIELLGEKAKAATPAMREIDVRLKGIRLKEMPATVVLSGDEDMAMFIGFSVQAFLGKHDR